MYLCVYVPICISVYVTAKFLKKTKISSFLDRIPSGRLLPGQDYRGFVSPLVGVTERLLPRQDYRGIVSLLVGVIVMGIHCQLVAEDLVVLAPNLEFLLVFGTHLHKGAFKLRYSVSFHFAS